MKTMTQAAILSVALTCAGVAMGEAWPGREIIAMSEISDSSTTNAAGLNPKMPEMYDWGSYFNGTYSTYDQRTRATFAAAILWKRLVTIESRFRLSMTNDAEQLGAFDRIQAKWRDLAAEETAFVAGQWTGGSGQKAAIPREKARLIQMRINALRTLHPDSAALYRE